MSSFRIIKDRAASGVMFGITILALVFVVVMGVALYIKSMPILAEHSLWELVSASSWQPFKNSFGFLPFVMGTIWVTAIAIVIALPLSLMTAVFLTEYAKKPVKKFVYPALDILASLPSVKPSSVIAEAKCLRRPSAVLSKRFDNRAWCLAPVSITLVSAATTPAAFASRWLWCSHRPTS